LRSGASRRTHSGAACLQKRSLFSVRGLARPTVGQLVRAVARLSAVAATFRERPLPLPKWFVNPDAKCLWFALLLGLNLSSGFLCFFGPRYRCGQYFRTRNPTYQVVKARGPSVSPPGSAMGGGRLREFGPAGGAICEICGARAWLTSSMGAVRGRDAGTCTNHFWFFGARPENAMLVNTALSRPGSQPATVGPCLCQKRIVPKGLETSPRP